MHAVLLVGTTVLVRVAANRRGLLLAIIREDCPKSLFAPLATSILVAHVRQSIHLYNIIK